MLTAKLGIPTLRGRVDGDFRGNFYILLFVFRVEAAGGNEGKREGRWMCTRSRVRGLASEVGQGGANSWHPQQRGASPLLLASATDLPVLHTGAEVILWFLGVRTILRVLFKNFRKALESLGIFWWEGR